LANRSITVPEYLQTYDSICSEILTIGELCDSLDSLTRKLNQEKLFGLVPFPWLLDKDTIRHEAEHAAKARKYNITPKFIFVYAGLSTGVYTWFSDLSEKAKDWTIEELTKFYLRVSYVKNPSKSDKKYQRLMPNLRT